MTDTTPNNIKLFKDYHNFDDGLLVSFTYFYLPDEPLAAKIVLYARNERIGGDTWRHVEIVVRDVQELCAKVKGNQFNAISSSVKLLRFGELWCVDVDGTYLYGKDPVSLDEIRKDGECYVIGRFVEVNEVPD
ncbi:hypothetical protein INH39_28980 [Massilia violaceinigra]|uniref:Uncharacterized protein n=1 Tax=Massilia violaceinigra TaxID=2045208 RepID=A0ABY4A3P8_9BURK|nr:hypothetical protein [Massilia violaceinigra]UOD29395.1 hypothetical protein INH39_28980 [Massilia violaceinigra]